MNEDYDLSSLYGEPPPKRQKKEEAEDAPPAGPAVAPPARWPVVRHFLALPLQNVSVNAFLESTRHE